MSATEYNGRSALLGAVGRGYDCCMYNGLPTSDAVEALWSEPCLAAKVRRVHRVITGDYDRALRGTDLTVAQLDLLVTLLQADGRRPIDLARDLQMDRSTLSRNLERLRSRSLVSITDGETRRESQVHITAVGRRTVEAAAEAWHEAQQATRSRLGDEGVAALDLLTRRLTDLKEK